LKIGDSDTKNTVTAMPLHFTLEEFAERRRRALAARGLDALLMFKQESMYWLMGCDTFGYCFFQCLVLRADGDLVLLTRAPDLRQAETSHAPEARAEGRGEFQPALRSSRFIFSRSAPTRLIASRIAGSMASRLLKSSPPRTRSWQ
jgi:Xaa-Pro aminopeptidase